MFITSRPTQSRTQKSLSSIQFKNIGSFIDQETDPQVSKPEKDKSEYNFNREVSEIQNPQQIYKKIRTLNRNSLKTHRLKQNPDAKSCRKLRSEGRHAKKNKNRGQTMPPHNLLCLFFLLCLIGLANANSVTK